MIFFYAKNKKIVIVYVILIILEYFFTPKKKCNSGYVPWTPALSYISTKNKLRCSLLTATFGRLALDQNIIRWIFVIKTGKYRFGTCKICTKKCEISNAGNERESYIFRTNDSKRRTKNEKKFVLSVFYHFVGKTFILFLFLHRIISRIK